MIRHRWNDVGDDIYDSANRAGPIKDGCGTTNHVDLRNADCLNRSSVSGIEGRQIAHAKPVLENQHLVVPKSSQNWSRWSGPEATDCDPWKIRDLLGESRPGTVLEFDQGFGCRRLILFVRNPRGWRCGDDDFFQLDRGSPSRNAYPRDVAHHFDGVGNRRVPGDADVDSVNPFRNIGESELSLRTRMFDTIELEKSHCGADYGPPS